MTEKGYSLKQLIELNILIMQAFLPEALTNKERDILVEYCLASKSPTDVFTKEVKAIVMEKSKLKDNITLNEYNKRLRNKHAFVVGKGNVWQINPMFIVPHNIDLLELSILIKKR